MKKLGFALVVALFGLSMLVTACQKQEAPKEQPAPPTAEQPAPPADQQPPADQAAPPADQAAPPAGQPQN
ncbi:MAG: hypothetical protein HS130_07905 [Deltaproteobacteria bacterium]|nr:hypothetical protein [Deltaproteobacteria bacterium]MCL4873063.1 hypothetical protein [bacterium]